MRQIEYDIMASVEGEHWWYKGLRRLLVDSLLRDGVMRKPWRILDLGCGTGGCYRAIRERFPDVSYVGIDIESRALTYCRQHGFHRLIQGSVNWVPLRREVADVIVCLDVLCETDVCPKTALEECFKVLRPGGLLILNLPAFESLRGQHDAAVAIGRRFRSGEVRSLLEQTGFRLLSITYWNMVLFFPVLIWRWCSRSEDEEEPRSDLTRSLAWLNPLLSALLWLEVTLARWVSLPFGSSVFLVGHKPH